jgi:hypothetical protein
VAPRALAVWAKGFAAQKRQFAASQRLANVLGVFEAAFPTLATLAIFAGAADAVGALGAAGPASAAGRLALNTGQFLAFFAAFGQSLAAVGEMAAAVGEALIAVPRLSRLRHCSWSKWSLPKSVIHRASLAAQSSSGR